MKFLFAFVLVLSLVSCKSKLDKQFDPDSNKIDVSAQIEDIKLAEMLSYSSPYIYDSLLLLRKWNPDDDRCITIYNKNSFKPVTQAVVIGKGPNENSYPGRMAINADSRSFWIMDVANKNISCYPFDSVLQNPRYLPFQSIPYSDTLIVDRYNFINDSVAMGVAISLLSPRVMNYAPIRLNFNSGKSERFGCRLPVEAAESACFFASSKRTGLYALPYDKKDVMLLCNSDGSLRFNICGPDYGHEKKGFSYFGLAEFTNNFLIVLYSGESSIVYDKKNRLASNWESRFVVFDLDGNYKATIETGCAIVDFCIDEDNHRVICYFNGRENPLGYFNFDFDKELK